MTAIDASRLLFLEDDADVAALFAGALSDAGFSVERVSLLAEFVAALRKAPPDLAILDLGLPDGDALSLFSDAENGPLAGTPVIVLTGRADLADKLRALEGGADDYLVKPIPPSELVARARAVLRRYARQDAVRPPAGAEPSIARFAGWRADLSAMTLQAEDGAEETLSASEAALLRAFLTAPGRVLTREFLLEICDPPGADLFDRSIDVRISRLRKKLRACSSGAQLIKTIYGAGYMFLPAVSWGR